MNKCICRPSINAEKLYFGNAMMADNEPAQPMLEHRVMNFLKCDNGV